MQIQLGLSARDRKTLMVGGTTVALLFALARGLPAALAWQRDRISDAATLTQQTTTSRTNARLLPARRDSLRAREARLAAIDSVMLSGPSASSAAADLAASLEEICDSSRFKVTAMQLRADSAATGSLVAVAVRVTGTTDVLGLAAFLHAVEGGDAPLIVREMAVTQPEPAAPAGKVESLRVDILVEAIARVIGPQSAKPEARR
jgi:hypothetical protein